MTTYFSKITYPNAGGDSEFSIPFEYLEQSHISVTLNAVAQVNGTDYTINESTSKVVFSGGTTAGHPVVIARETPIATDDLAVSFSDGSGLNATDLNASTKQNIFAIQEQDDEITDSIAIVATAMLGANNLSDVDSASTSRTNLDVYSKAETDDIFADATGALLQSNNLSDVSDAATSRTNLGLGTIATQDSDDISITGGSISGITDLAIADGGTGAGTATEAFDNLAPTTTKGDIIISNGSDNIRVGVGSDDEILIADSAEASGVKWGLPAFFGFRAGRTTTAQSLPDITTTDVIFNSETFDSDGCYDTATGRFTPTRAGYYQVNASVAFESSGMVANDYMYMAISKNTTAMASERMESGNAINETLGVSDVVYCNGSTDYIKVSVLQSSGGAINILAESSTAFSAAFVGS